MIKPKTLEIGYYDPDVLILHSCMHVLVDFFEYQLLDGHVDWFYDDEMSGAFKEMKAIYEWWSIDRIKLEDKINDFYDDGDNRKYKYSSEDIHRFTVEMYHKEQEMLTRLINIRRFMWD